MVTRGGGRVPAPSLRTSVHRMGSPAGVVILVSRAGVGDRMERGPRGRRVFGIRPLLPAQDSTNVDNAACEKRLRIQGGSLPHSNSLEETVLRRMVWLWTQSSSVG